MRQIKLRAFLFSFLVLAIAGTVQSFAAMADEPETVVVSETSKTTSKTPDQKVADAHQKIGLTEAWGATYGVNDVREEVAIIHNAQGFPASVH